jgi:hypothetical protein
LNGFYGTLASLTKLFHVPGKLAGIGAWAFCPRNHDQFSVRMEQLADNVVDPKKNGVGVQLTDLKGTDTPTVTSVPEEAELGGLGLTETVAPLIEPFVKYVLTVDVTVAVAVPGKIPTRAPSLAALVMIC